MVALRSTQSAITERQFRSTWSGKTYTGWYLDGKMVGCSCPWKAVHLHQECKHQRQHNALNSCCYCGRLTKGIVCYQCIS